MMVAIVAVDNGQFGFLKLSDIQSNMSMLGDINNDSTIDVLDAVLLVNIVLGISTSNSNADINQDGSYNVLDVVQQLTLLLTK